VEDADVAAAVPRRPRHPHKWASALGVVAGSPGMEGAAAFAAGAAARAGAGMVRLAVPGGAAPGGGTRPGPWPLEAVRVALPAEGWAGAALAAVERCRAVVVGPGLGRDEATQAEVRRLIAALEVPVVVDADALVALGDTEAVRRLADPQRRALVLTPHDGEYEGLAGVAPGADRIAAARRLAERSGAVVLVKGALTAVADPGADGPPDVLLAAAGGPRLATAGTGDVLSGVIGAFIARGTAPARAAALAAHVHGAAASAGRSEGLVAGDLAPLIGDWLSRELDA
jgi:ADP-dependent NAD(P)H-hydrate dehydratase / NAD(P)H-hydrate epimerase